MEGLRRLYGLLQVQAHILLLLNLSKFRAFFGHSEKNSSSKKLKTQANSHKNSSKISEKLKNRQLNLSICNIKIAFSFQKCAQANFFSKSYTLQAL